jgi:hypothetical protein
MPRSVGLREDASPRETEPRGSLKFGKFGFELGCGGLGYVDRIHARNGDRAAPALENAEDIVGKDDVGGRSLGDGGQPRAAGPRNRRSTEVAKDARGLVSPLPAEDLRGNLDAGLMAV